MIFNKKKLWEILIPKYTNNKKKYSVKHHRVWDKKVREVSGDITILKPAKCQWINPSGKMFEDEMIPARLLCSEKNMAQIVEFTMNHYNDQEAILVYVVSEDVRFIFRDKNKHHL